MKELRIKRIDKNLPLPEYKTSGAAAFDLAARITVTIKSKDVGYVPLNVCIRPPEGHYVMLVPRSSLHKRGLMPANGFGVIDRDYSGNGDEYIAALYNYTDQDVLIEGGERIMQAVVAPVAHIEFIEVDDMGSSDRGGFGTTGKN